MVSYGNHHAMCGINPLDNRTDQTPGIHPRLRSSISGIRTPAIDACAPRDLTFIESV
jgi:hypothetical protein